MQRRREGDAGAGLVQATVLSAGAGLKGRSSVVSNAGRGRSPQQVSAWRRPVAGLLLAMTLLLTGCVYLRLLEVKRQLANFDRYFAVEESAGLEVRFRKPVLRDEDVMFLGLVPAERIRTGSAERWRFRWVKDPAPGDAPGLRYEQTAEFVFANQRLASVLIPEQFFAFFPKSRVIASLRSIGQASVDRRRRTASGALAPTAQNDSLPPLRETDLMAMLGAPVATGGSAEAPEWRYSFQAIAAGGRTGPIDVVFTLHPRTGTVQHVKGRLIAGTIEFDYSGGRGGASRGGRDGKVETKRGG